MKHQKNEAWIKLLHDKCGIKIDQYEEIMKETKEDDIKAIKKTKKEDANPFGLTPLINLN